MDECCRTTSEAAGKDHTNCMRRLHEQGVTWDANTTLPLAARDDLESLIMLTNMAAAGMNKQQPSLQNMAVWLL